MSTTICNHCRKITTIVNLEKLKVEAEKYVVFKSKSIVFMTEEQQEDIHNHLLHKKIDQITLENIVEEFNKIKKVEEEKSILKAYCWLKNCNTISKVENFIQNRLFCVNKEELRFQIKRGIIFRVPEFLLDFIFESENKMTFKIKGEIGENIVKGSFEISNWTIRKIKDTIWKFIKNKNSTDIIFFEIDKNEDYYEIHIKI